MAEASESELFSMKIVPSVSAYIKTSLILRYYLALWKTGQEVQPSLLTYYGFFFLDKHDLSSETVAMSSHCLNIPIAPFSCGLTPPQKVAQC